MPNRSAAGIDPATVLWSADAKERAGRPLLVMMHGWSYDEKHLFSLVSELPDDLVIASLRASIPEAGGYAWFPSAGNPIGNPQPQVANRAVREVISWLDTVDAPSSSIGLLGFSQGGAMALQLMRHAPSRFAYAVNLAGFVVDDEQPGDSDLVRLRRQVLWSRGGLDRVIPSSALTRTQSWLQGHADADIRVYAGLGHDVAGQEVTDLAAFVASQL